MGYISFSPGYQRAETIDLNISNLGQRDSLKRKKARQALINIGKSAAPALVRALHSPNGMTRWEAAKALEQIHAPGAAPALVEALRDRDPGVRWLAAEGLISLKNDAVGPLLQGLKDHSDSIWMRESALHVLHGLQKRNLLSLPLTQVLAALSGPEPVVEVPWAAYAASQTLA